jgi:hypothetical protein
LKCEALSSTTGSGAIPAEGDWATWRLTLRAKQSQFSPEVSSLKCEVSSSTPAPGGDPGRWRLGHMVADAPCRTKPNWDRGRGLRSAECGLKRGTVVRNKAEFRQDGGSRKRRTLPVGEPRRRPEHAEQSQFRAEVSSLKCEVSSSTPAPGGDPSRGRLGCMAPDPSCETKPIEAVGSVCSVPVRASSEETPDGVTTNATDSVKQSQSDGSRDDHRQASLDAATQAATTDSAKQSRCCGPVGGRRVVGGWR